MLGNYVQLGNIIWLLPCIIHSYSLTLVDLYNITVHNVSVNKLWRNKYWVIPERRFGSFTNKHDKHHAVWCHWIQQSWQMSNAAIFTAYSQHPKVSVVVFVLHHSCQSVFTDAGHSSRNILLQFLNFVCMCAYVCMCVCVCVFCKQHI